MEKTLNYIKNKGFSHIKFEIEGNLNRDSSGSCDYCDNGYIECEESHYCDDCSGSGQVNHGDDVPDNCDCERNHRCNYCDGEGYIECEHDTACQNCDGYGNDGSMSDDYCETTILNTVSTEAREALTFGRFYNDGSVDSEYTFTLPIEKAHFAPEFIEAFKALADESGSLDDNNAGLHIAVLTEGTYPCSKGLNSDKLANFRTEVAKLLPALYFLGTANHKSRKLGFREPQISDSKYSAIHYMRGCLEYRVFDPCFDNPQAVLDYVDVIAKTLKFYGKSTVKNVYFEEFVFPEGKEVVSRFFQTPEAISVLDQGLAVLKPKGNIEELKRKRGIKLKPGKQEGKLRADYAEYVLNRERRKWTDLYRKLQRMKNESFSTPEERLKYIKEFKRILESEYQPYSFDHWKLGYSGSNHKTITMKGIK